MRIPNTPLVVDEFSLRRTPRCQCAPPLLYFLTHMHADHTVGLTPSWNFGPIYCTRTTRLLCLEKFKLQDPSILHELEVGRTSVVYLDQHCTISMNVTALPAYHCPGACMFLFEGYFGKILCTGDFRFDHDSHYDRLLKSLGSPSKPLNQLYIDNTYCEGYDAFKPRSEASALLLSALKNYPRDCCILVGIDTLGKEELVLKVAKAMESLVLVPNARYEALKILGLDAFATTNPEDARIAIVPRKEITMSNSQSWGGNTIGVLASGFGRISQDNGMGAYEIRNDLDVSRLAALDSSLDFGTVNGLPKVLQVRYSLHCSSLELKRFLERIPAKGIFPASCFDSTARDCLRQMATDCQPSYDPNYSHLEFELPSCFQPYIEGKCACGNQTLVRSFQHLVKQQTSRIGVSENQCSADTVLMSKRKRVQYTKVRRKRHRLDPLDASSLRMRDVPSTRCGRFDASQYCEQAIFPCGFSVKIKEEEHCTGELDVSFHPRTHSNFIDTVGKLVDDGNHKVKSSSSQRVRDTQTLKEGIRKNTPSMKISCTGCPTTEPFRIVTVETSRRLRIENHLNKHNSTNPLSHIPRKRNTTRVVWTAVDDRIAMAIAQLGQFSKMNTERKQKRESLLSLLTAPSSFIEQKVNSWMQRKRIKQEP